MKAWLISIVALSIGFVLVELLLNEGELKKYISGILRVIFVISVFGAFVNLFNGSFDIDVVFGKGNKTEDTATLDYFVKVREKETENAVETELEKLGIKQSDVNILSYRDGEKQVVDTVSVDLTNSVITEEAKNIIGIEDIVKAVKTHVDVPKERIIVYGWIEK